jgi:hypothetical protein
MNRSFRRLAADPRLFLETQATVFHLELAAQPGVFSLKLFDPLVLSASSWCRSRARRTVRERLRSYRSRQANAPFIPSLQCANNPGLRFLPWHMRGEHRKRVSEINHLTNAAVKEVPVCQHKPESIEFELTYKHEATLINSEKNARE